MTLVEVIIRLGRLDIRDAEPDDYEALYLAIQMISRYGDKMKENDDRKT